MIFKVKVNAIFHCSLERAFKTPMLTDLSKVHTGFGFMPKISHVSEDELWGQPGSSKKVFAEKSITQKGGFISMDRVIERIENTYWKIQVDQFQSWMLGFYKFEGEWKTTELQPNKIGIEYIYSLHSKTFIWYPLNYIFAKTFWKMYMKRVVENIRKMVDDEEPYLYQ